MKVIKMERPPRRLFCMDCGKEEHEGYVFGKYVTRHLTTKANGEVRCVQCDKKRFVEAYLRNPEAAMKARRAERRAQLQH